MRSALRHLCQHGAAALQPQKVITKAVEHGSHVAKISRPIWRRSLLSKRVANTLRKQAIQDGTYGSFDGTTGVGWDPTWDLVLHSNRHEAMRVGNIQPKKKTARERSREERANKIEQNLETRLETMDQYYTEKEASRVQEENFEARYKRMMRGSGPAGGGR